MTSNAGDASDPRIERVARAWADRDLAAAVEQLAALAHDCASETAAGPVRDALAAAPGIEAVAPAQASYFVAQALLVEHELMARLWFVRAMDSALQCGDLALARDSGAAALVCYLLSFDGRKDMKHVQDVFCSMPAETPAASEPNRSLRLVGRLCASYLSRSFQLSSEEIDDAVTQVLLDLPYPERWPSPSLQLACAVAMVDFAGAFLTTERARDVAMATSAVAARASALLRLRALWWAERAWLYANDSEGVLFTQCLGNVDTLAQELDDDSIRFQSLRLRCAVALRTGRVDDGLALLPSFEQLTELHESEATEHSRLKAAVLIMAGRCAEALELTAASLRLARARAAESGESCLLIELEHVHALAACSRLREAAELLRLQADQEYGAARERSLALAYAYDWLASGEQDEESLRQCLKTASRSGAYQLLPRDPGGLARVCDAALRRDLEVSFVCELIGRRRLRPPAFACDQWPWAVRIETFGGCRLHIGGLPYRPERKAQDKVLELLKLLVAAQVLRRGDAERDWLCEHLWPEAEVSKARKSLETSVARLRRLLQNEATVIVSEGRVGLDDALVWSDAAAVVQAWSRIKEVQDSVLQQRPAATDRLLADVSGMLALYNGPFLQGDEESPWVIGARAQFSRLLRQALLALEHVLASGQQHEFTLLLERAHCADPSSEEIAQMLMRHHLARANHVEALRVYRRTKDTIHAVFGAQPSPQTELLGREVFRAVERDATVSSNTHH
jgi:DNA-binding SARP family transcriptional activator